MNLITIIMGMADLICIILIIYAFGLQFWAYPLVAIMGSKGVMSLL